MTEVIEKEERTSGQRRLPGPHARTSRQDSLLVPGPKTSTCFPADLRVRGADAPFRGMLREVCAHPNHSLLWRTDTSSALGEAVCKHSTKRAFPHPPRFRPGRWPSAPSLEKSWGCLSAPQPRAPEGTSCTRSGPREETPGGAGQAHTSGRAQLPIGPGQAVETRGRDANGGADLLPQDCGPGVHLRHVSQVPGTEANSARTTEVFRWRCCPPPGPVGRWCRRVQLRPPGTPVASRPRAARPTGGSASQEAAPRGPVLCSSGPTSPPPLAPGGLGIPAALTRLSALGCSDQFTEQGLERNRAHSRWPRPSLLRQNSLRKVKEGKGSREGTKPRERAQCHSTGGSFI